MITAKQAKKIIDRAGGPAGFGHLLGIDGEPGYWHRVYRWRTRGIPLLIYIHHRVLLNRLLRALEQKPVSEDVH